MGILQVVVISSGRSPRLESGRGLVMAPVQVPSFGVSQGDKNPIADIEKIMLGRRHELPSTLPHLYNYQCRRLTLQETTPQSAYLYVAGLVRERVRSNQQKAAFFP